MNELERALEAYRSEVKPSAERREAMTSVVLGASPAAAGTTSTVLLAAVGAVLGGAILAVILATRPGPPPEPAPVPPTEPPASTGSMEPASSRDSAAPPEPAAVSTPVVTAAPAVAPAPATAPSSPAPKHARPRTKPAPAVVEDMRLLREAERALERDPAAALKLLRTHATRHPNSPLAPERAALRVLALCSAGKTAQGTTARDAFLKQHPRSPYEPRVKAACVDGD